MKKRGWISILIFWKKIEGKKELSDCGHPTNRHFLEEQRTETTGNDNIFITYDRYEGPLLKS